VALANIFDVVKVNEAIRDYGPDVVINAAAKCGRPNIDWCNRAENRELTETVNTYGPKILQDVCHHMATKFIHISSGCIWEKGEGLKETDLADPPSWYSLTKVNGELMLDHTRTLIVRPRMPIDGTPSPRNLINKLAGYSMVLKESNSVSVIGDLLYAIMVLIEKDRVGIYHVANPGSITAAEIMRLYVELIDPNHKFTVVDMDYLWQNGLITDGRSNVVLNTDKLVAEGVNLPDAQTRVRQCMEEYAQCKLNTSQAAG